MIGIVVVSRDRPARKINQHVLTFDVQLWSLVNNLAFVWVMFEILDSLLHMLRYSSWRSFSLAVVRCSSSVRGLLRPGSGLSPCLWHFVCHLATVSRPSARFWFLTGMSRYFSSAPSDPSENPLNTFIISTHGFEILRILVLSFACRWICCDLLLRDGDDYITYESIDERRPTTMRNDCLISRRLPKIHKCLRSSRKYWREIWKAAHFSRVLPLSLNVGDVFWDVPADL